MDCKHKYIIYDETVLESNNNLAAAQCATCKKSIFRSLTSLVYTYEQLKQIKDNIDAS